MPQAGRHIIKSLLPFLLFVLLCQTIAIMVTAVRGVPFPTPWQTSVKFGALVGGERLSDHTLFCHILDSLTRWLLGFGIAAICGIAYWLVAGWSRLFETATGKILQILQLIPGLAWIPVAILIFGIGETARILGAAAGLSINVTIQAMKRHSNRLTLDEAILSSLRQTARFLKAQKIIELMPNLSRTVIFSLLESQKGMTN